MKKESNNDKSVVVFAYQNMGIIGLTSLIEKGVKIIHVITHKDNPNHDVWWDSVAEFCKKKNICFSFIEDTGHEDVYNSIKDHDIQCIFSFHYRRIIPEKILELALHGGINLHCSPLPKYKGKAPVNWQIINGESFTGVSLHYMTKEIDSGDIIDVKKTKILDSDDIMSVYNKLEQVAKNLLSHNIPLIIEGKNKRYSQNLNDSTYFGGRKPEDGRIDWNKSSKEILNLIRAITKPYPGAFTTIGDKKYIIWKAKQLKNKSTPTPMHEDHLVTSKNLYFKTKDGFIEVNDFNIINIK